MRRGDVYWADLEPTRGGEIRKRRPVVVISNDGLAQRRRTVVVVPLTTGPQPRPPLVIATPSAGAGSSAVCDQIRALDRTRFGPQLGRLSGDDQARLDEALRTCFDL